MGFFAKLKEKFFGKKEEKEDKKYVQGLTKSRKEFVGKMNFLSKKYKKVNEEYFEDLEEILIEADCGVDFTLSTIEKVLQESKKRKLSEPDEINSLLVEVLIERYKKGENELSTEINFVEGTTVMLVSGVNGVGKTTSIAKLANRYLKQGKSVMVAAADTFRAGAKEQLTVWADRLGIHIIYGKENADPASVCFDACKKAKEKNIDLLIIDTAGRLQTKANLMSELEKMNRVITKEFPDGPHESLLVIDATTGQNGLQQARSFLEVGKVTGLVVTKMDGSSKGGILLSIKETFGIPVKFIGLGEGIDDLEEFDLDKFLYGLILGEEDE